MRIGKTVSGSVLGFVLFCSYPHALAQEPPDAPTLKPGENANALFVATIPALGAKDEHGQPELASIEPVAFLSGDRILDCAREHPGPKEEPIPKSTIDTLNRLYARGNRYPLWSGGSPWGEIATVKSCIDEDYLDLDGCVQTHPDPNQQPTNSVWKGIVWTGAMPVSGHLPIRVTASSDERSRFLLAASAIYSSHHVSVQPSSIHTSPVIRIAIREGHTALAASTVVQLAAREPNIYYSYRLFMVIESDNHDYQIVLTHFHRTTVHLENAAQKPGHGEILDEEEYLDKEELIDTFPLFGGEPDAIITEHTFYESWAFSIYRYVGSEYKLVYTGCGGGT